MIRCSREEITLRDICKCNQHFLHVINNITCEYMLCTFTLCTSLIDILLNLLFLPLMELLRDSAGRCMLYLYLMYILHVSHHHFNNICYTFKTHDCSYITVFSQVISTVVELGRGTGNTLHLSVCQ